MENTSPRSPSIATRTGDAGQTSLLFGERVSKTHPQVEACGAVDELNAFIGLAKAAGRNEELRGQLEKIQTDLIALMGELAVPSADLEKYEESGFPKIDDLHLAHLDRLVHELETSAGGRFEGWATPGATLAAAHLDVARTAARRAERRVVALHEHQVPLRPLLQKYLNRLSDLLWLMARRAEKE